MKRLFFALILFAHSSFVFSYDFGVLSYQQAEADNSMFSYACAFIPWYSHNAGSGLQVYASGRFIYSYDNSDADNVHPAFLPEILRFSAAYRASNRFYVEAGRIGYSDPLGMTAAGLFDGARVETALGKGSLSAGAFYTGLLYKETAMIVMNGADIASYLKPWDYGSFENYFASKRFLASLRYDMLLLEYHLLSFESLAQFDLNGADETLHSQYGSAMIELFPMGKTGFAFGAVVQMMENSEGDFNMGLGALARFRMDAPGPLNDGFNITAKFGSGNWSDTFTAFTPVCSPAQGILFPGNISGLAVFSADYMVRLNRALFAETAFLYFTRSYNETLAKGNFYGGEFQASVQWQPLEDVRLTAAGAAFFPGIGNAYPDGSDIMWKIRAGLAISF